MSVHQKVATVAVSSASVTIMSGLGNNAVAEITAIDTGLWVNVIGGVASIGADGCIYIPVDKTVYVTTEDGITSLTAIRDQAPDGRAQVALLSLGGSR